jgi:hypothetical protein
MTETKYIALGIILGYLTPYLLDLRQNNSVPFAFSQFTNHQEK